MVNLATLLLNFLINLIVIDDLDIFEVLVGVDLFSLLLLINNLVILLQGENFILVLLLLISHMIGLLFIIVGLL